MGDVVKTIGATARDYATFQLWEDDLDDSGIYTNDDHAIGDCYDDSDFTDGVDISDTANIPRTVNGGEVTLRAASGEQHNGTADTGVRMLANANGDRLRIFTIPVCVYNVEGLEWDGNGVTGWNSPVNLNRSGRTMVLRKMIVQDFTTGTSEHAIHCVDGTCKIENCLIYDIDAAAGTIAGIETTASNDAGTYVYHCTVYNVTTTGGNGLGIRAADNANIDITNCAAFACDTDFSIGASATFATSGSSDATGTSGLTSLTDTTEFTDPSGRDFHLKSGSTLEGAGTDITATVPEDVDGDTRASSPDVGFDEFTAGAAETYEAAWGTRVVFPEKPAPKMVPY